MHKNISLTPWQMEMRQHIRLKKINLSWMQLIQIKRSLGQTFRVSRMFENTNAWTLHWPSTHIQDYPYMHIWGEYTNISSLPQSLPQNISATLHSEHFSIHVV